jgi:exonuclease SbcC
MTKSKLNSKGSEWRKWDLHLHTPLTKLSDNYKIVDTIDIWELYSDKIEESDVSVFGITDYFCCENYFHFVEYHKQKHPNSEKIFLPNIEFRLDISVNKSAEEINIHLIFSNDVSKNQIDNFLTILKTSHTNSNSARITCKNLNSSQYVSATINHNELIQSLNEVFGSHKPYIILAAANNAGLRPVKDSPRKLTITDEIDKICDAFFGGRQNVDYYLGIDRYETDEISKPKPVLSGSDCHSFEDLESFLGKYVERENTQNTKIEIHKDITWIKADTTFEGLKQVLFEPEHRIKISEQKPREPIRKIESITFNFPSNTFIKRNNSNDKQEFCLNNLKTNIFFSPYFTCLIGGRGTGKSTIINLLGERLGEKTDFFKENNLIINNAIYHIENDTNSIINVSGTNEIEFVSQGKIERLAEGNELTKLIFNERIKEVESGFYSLDSEIESITDTIDETIKLLFDLSKNQSNLKIKNKEKSTTQNIIDSVNDDRYKEITNKINETRKEINSIKNSQLKYENILSSIRTLLLENNLTEASNEVEIRINEIISLLKTINEFDYQENDIILKLKEFENTNTRIDILNQEFITQNQNLKEFFQEKGMSEETIKDSQKANENLAQLNSEISILENTNQRFINTFKENNVRISELLQLNNSYNELINKNISIINKKLEVNNENVLNINFTFEFDNLEFKNNLFNEFYDTFSKHHIPNTTISRVMEVLFLIEPNIDLLNLDFKSFALKIDNEIELKGHSKNNNYVKIILDIFSININFQIYKLLVRKHLFNLSNYIKIKGYYGERELQNCSFGQRCTAVIVTLLMTGVKPLVIDEPEAHLDNRLVADYLVNLIKNKKLDRQIIFATHNSNFVINGDSELIHILDIPLNNIFTNITSTTIENIGNREKLLKLEGGRDAFMIREQKYGIHN